MKDWTQSKPRCDGVYSGFSLEVSLSVVENAIGFGLVGLTMVLCSFLADKSMSILLGRPICLRDEDCTLHFPKEVDDE